MATRMDTDGMSLETWNLLRSNVVRIQQLTETIENNPREASFARSMRKQTIEQLCRITDEWLQTPKPVKLQATYTPANHEEELLAHSIYYLVEDAQREPDATKRNGMTSEIIHRTKLLARTIAEKVQKYALKIPKYESMPSGEGEFDMEAIEKYVVRSLTTQEALDAWKEAQAADTVLRNTKKAKARQNNARKYRFQNVRDGKLFFFEDDEYVDESDWSRVSSEGYCSSEDSEEHDASGDMPEPATFALADNHSACLDEDTEQGASGGKSAVETSLVDQSKDAVVKGMETDMGGMEAERILPALTVMDEVEQDLPRTTEMEPPETVFTTPQKRQQSPEKEQKMTKRQRRIEIKRAEAELARQLALLDGDDDESDKVDED